MAETKQNKATDDRVAIRLPRNKEQGATQDEFYSVNFKNYIIKRGETVLVPKGVAVLIEQNRKAEDAAFEYVEANKLPDNLK